jgi:sugar O-acyltransferase (sialic acid O-acetyltransferase NeuD family)
MPLAASTLGAQPGARLVFVDDAPKAASVNGHSILTYEGFLREPAARRFVSVAVAEPRVRQRIVERCMADGIEPFTVRAENTVIMDDVQFGEGAILSPFVTLTSNIRVGRWFHANLYSYVEHDCRIGDFVTFAPGVQCNGCVVIEDFAYLGAGCVLRQGTPDAPLVVGRGAVIGMGAIVTCSVPAGETVVGNPARVLVRADRAR